MSAEGPYSRGGGAQLLVGDHVAGLVDGDARGRRADLVGVGDPAGGYQQHVGPLLAAGTVAVDQIENHLLAVTSGRLHPRVEPDVEAPAVGRGEAAADLVVLAAQERVAPQNEGHLRAQSAHHRAHLGRDVTPAHHQQTLGEGIEAHDRVGGVVPAALQTGHVGHRGPGARRDHNPVGSNLLAVHCHPLGGREAGRACEHGHVGQFLAVLAPALGDGVDAAEDAVSDGGPVRSVEPGPHPEALPVGGLLGQLRRVHEHLGRNAPNVEAGAPEEPALDYRDVPGVVLGPDHRVARSRADDQQVEGAHRARHPTGTRSPPKGIGSVCPL